jgi:hypothetical protein
MQTMDYREIVRILTAEGHTTRDIDAAIDSLIESGITHAEEDDLILTGDEVEVLRLQLSSL